VVPQPFSPPIRQLIAKPIDLGISQTQDPVVKEIRWNGKNRCRPDIGRVTQINHANVYPGQGQYLYFVSNGVGGIASKAVGANVNVQ
jgi:hypothetical protein